jgi:hypothetical protein
MGRWKRKESKKRDRKAATLNVEDAQESEFEFSLTSSSSTRVEKNGNNVAAEPDEGSAAIIVDDLMIGSSSTTHSPAALRIQRNFNIFEQERLYEYLLEYKCLSERQYCAQISHDDGGDSIIVQQKSQNLVVNSSNANEEESCHVSEYNCSEGLDVGGHLFPKLNLENVSSKPYLILPKTLNKKQRRCLHELCIEGVA